MYAGRKVEEAEVGELFSRPLHPYTVGLLASIPRLDLMRGQASATPAACRRSRASCRRCSTCREGCAFAPRCNKADDLCRARAAVLRTEAAQATGPPAGTPMRCSLPSMRARLALEVKDLKKHFPVTRACCAAACGHVACRRRHQLLRSASARPWALVGESGCGKTTAGRAVLRLIEPTSGSIAVRRHRHHAAAASRTCGPTARRHADHLPGPVLLAQSAHDGGRHRGRAAAGARPAARREERDDRSRPCSRRVGLRPAQMTQLPARVLRRPAPAHRHRPRAGARPEADRGRRAGLGARRLDPGPGDQPPAGPAARASALLPVHLAQSRGGRAHQPPHRRHVSRPHRRAMPTRARSSPAPQHPYTEALLSAVPVPDPAIRRAEAWSCRATCRARSSRRRAATSTRAAPTPSTAARSNRLRCAKSLRASGFLPSAMTALGHHPGPWLRDLTREGPRRCLAIRMEPGETPAVRLDMNWP